MKFTAAVFTALVAVVAAVRQPDYSKPPHGNPIALPGLAEQVPAGQEYTITWTPTSPGPVSIQLLRGPSENVVPIQVLTPSTPNTGSFKWTPSLSLEADVSRYGLLIVDETTGEYQWSTQFGIKNDAPQQPTLSVTRTVIEPPQSTNTDVVTITTTICEETTAPYPTGTAPGTISSVWPTAPTSYRASPTPTIPPPFEGAAGRNAISLGGAFVALAAVFAF
ncbi:predicted protein [Uncinocarpus reesii 1704]|uniref:Yeast cell wall synthesis Kre9/Knh1-like N-terminal domain-containing protein n=1 Tax=Uncinocarpus reesii (strain UAMH 1704) TaxID=336963 RepID=C4JJJ7_UNCRE|nr:uncharacterized protein UREG_01804 [Uncinocarpus reesii 1704]EEP76955.1 predicted protein [Uncinocarpus reesii 1704]